MKELITLRPTTESDTEFARQVHHAAYHDVVVRQFGSWDEKMQDDFFARSWKPESHQTIYFDGKPCGYYSVEYKPDFIFARELVILPEYQGKGIGSKILKGLIEESKRKHVPIRLQVFKENKAQHLYRRLGFKDAESADAHIQMVFNP